MRGFLCKNDQGSVTLTSIQARAKSVPTVSPIAKGAALIVGTADGTQTLCVFEILLKVPAESKNLIYDLSTPHHILVASGDVEEGRISYHRSNRFVTEEKIDVTKILVRVI